MGKRVKWPKNIEDAILTKSHHRCCVCPEHRMIAAIHHIDGNASNSIEDNGVGLCGECHINVHTKSTMRRSITPGQVKIYKHNWEKACVELAHRLRAYAEEFPSCYYVNVHRLDAICRELVGKSIYSEIPHKYTQQAHNYNTLWSNPKNSLTWLQLAENRSYYESQVRKIIPNVKAYDINLLELDAFPTESMSGQFISFACQFIGQDIPDQTELVDNLGLLEAPPPTMRRVVINEKDSKVLETCLMIDPQYMYSDSAFLTFSESGFWKGVGRVIKYRKAVGSNDGPLLRNQLIVSPIFIATPGSRQTIVDQEEILDDVQDGYRSLVENLFQMK